MLRPATPLTILLLAAFALLLISVISTPIVRGIPLASEGGIDFGVFGFCNGSDCSGIEIGYSTNKLTTTENASFDLPSSTRKTLSAILIVHPIAALFTLIELILAISAHFHSPSHSPRYLLCVFILSIVTFLLSLLCFLVDVLLFVPHMAWGSYIVLAATILVAISGIVSCAMRRTLVSRKARKKRIAENAEMNGENFYNNRQAGATIPPVATTAMASGALGSETKEPGYASFELQKSNTTDQSRTSDERIPLTARSPSNISPNSQKNGMPMGMDERYGGSPNRGGYGAPRGGMNVPRPYNGPRDEFGNPLPPSGAFGGSRSRDPSQDSQMRNQYPGAPMRGRGGPIMRARGGGYGPPARGGYGPPGPGRGAYGPPPPGRGGYSGPPRAAYQQQPRGGMMAPMAGAMASGMAGGMMGRGRGPPPGYSNGYNNNRPSPPQGFDGYAMDYGRRPSGPNAPAYGRNPSPGPPNSQGYVAYPGNMDDSEDLPRAESPPPMPDTKHDGEHIGQAVEMDASGSSPPRSHYNSSNNPGALRDSDGDVAGMVGLQQSGLPAHLRRGDSDRVMTLQSETSHYSNNEPYVPPRQAWGDAGPPGSRHGSPQSNNNAAHIPNEPVELPVTSYSPEPANLNRPQTAEGDYYEDVDPRFAEPELQPRTNSATSHHGSQGSQRVPSRASAAPPALQLPSTRLPGMAAYNPNNLPSQSNNMGGLHPMSQIPNYDGSDYDDMDGFMAGSRSPAESEGGQSNFTSVSQRGINPRWTGGPAERGGGGGFILPRRPVPPRNDQAILLSANPDFELPGAGPAGRGLAGRGLNANNGRGVLPRSGLIGSGPYPGS